jgi:hypothetical protein
MTTNFLYAQAPNRKGNIGKLSPSHDTGATKSSAPQHGTATPKGSQGAPAYARATDNTAAGATAGRKQKVMVSTHADYCGTIKNDGYMSKSVKNYGG